VQRFNEMRWRTKKKALDDSTGSGKVKISHVENRFQAKLSRKKKKEKKTSQKKRGKGESGEQLNGGRGNRRLGKHDGANQLENR